MNSLRGRAPWRVNLQRCHRTVGSSFSSRHRLVPCLVSSRLVSSRLVSAAALALALAACGDGADTTATLPTTRTLPTTPTPDPTVAQCRADQTISSKCPDIIAAADKAEQDRKAGMPFGGLTAETLPFSIAAIREAGLQAKAVQIPDPEDAANKFWSGAIFLISATGTASDDATLKFYGVQAGNIDRRTGVGIDDDDTPSNKFYNLATKFTANSNGKYSIDIFHIAKDRDDNNLGRVNVGGEFPRNYQLESFINLEDPDGGEGVLKKLTTLSSTGTGAYTEIASLDLKEQLGLKDTDKTLDNWNYTILSGNSKIYPDDAKAEGTFYAEVWDNRGASDGSPSSDYMVGGVWLLTPKANTNKNHNFAAFAQTSSPYGGSSGYGTSGTDSPAFRAVSGKATYHGLAAGLYLDDMNKIHRLLGKVKLDVDFTDNGTVEGQVTNFTLGGEKVSGALVLKEYTMDNNSNIASSREDNMRSTISGSINDVTMMGDWSGVFTGPDVTGNTAETVKKPTGMVGTVSGYSEDEKHTFAVSFGAREQPKETTSN